MNCTKIWRRSLLLALLAAALLTVCAGAEESGETSSGQFYYGPLTQRSAEENDILALQSMRTVFEESHLTYRDQLDDMGKQIYDALDDAMGAGNYTLTVTLTGEDIISHMLAAYSAYDDDHPFETAVTTGLVSYTQTGDDTYTLTAETTTEHPAERLEKLSQAVERFYSQYERDVDPAAADFEKYRYIYDYVAQACYYNYPVYNDRNNAEREYGQEVYDVIYNAYGALVGLDGVSGGEKGAVVCQGYADTYLLLCQRVGLPCVMITGGTRTASTQNFPTTANHAWNAIRLDGKWYAVDATWDDIDSTYSNENYSAMYGAVSISTLSYRYFADNRYFVEGSEEVAQNHKAYSQCKFKSAYWHIGAPPLECRRYTEETPIPKELKLTLHAPDEGGAAHFSDIQFALRLTFTGRVALRDIPNVEISLPDSAVFADNYPYGSGTCTVPAGKKYTVIGSAEKNTVLTRDDGFSGALFSVENGAVLDLRFVTLDGEDTPADSPLLQTAAASDTAESLVSLNHSQVTGNRGACGISADGAVLLAGNCKIQNNTIDGSKPSNLKLGSNGYIVVLDALDGAQVGVTTAVGQPFAWPNRDYAWTETDRAAFTPDDPSLIVAYNPMDGGLYCTDTMTGDQSRNVYITYAAVMPSVGAISSCPITLTNTTDLVQTVTLYAAMYDGDGRMLELQWLDTVALGAQEAGEPILLPEAPEDTATYQIFAVSGDWAPLAESIAYQF